MSATAPRSPGSAVAASEEGGFPEVLAQVLRSRAFEKTPALRALLVFLWQHRDEAISEYAIATEALGRSSLFDARTDATVRVQISRLRQRLERFYESEGQNATERLVIPLGSHQVQIEAAEATRDGSPDRVSPWIAEAPKPRRGRAVLALGIACVVLAGACAVLGLELLRTRHEEKAPGNPVAAAFWQRFFGNGRRTRIVLPTPVFFSFHVPTLDPNGNIMFRDTDVNDFESRGRSTPLRSLEKTLGAPELAQNYTVTSDTFASVHLARYLDRAGLDTTVLSSADAPMAALDRENVIALGTWGTLTPLKSYLDRMTFVLESHERHVENRTPAAGEPKTVSVISESPTRSVWPGLIAVLPGPANQTHLLILSSRHTSALVSFLTSTSGLDELERIWKQKGSPEFYEVLLNSEMDDDMVVRFWVVALHPYPGNVR
jgi:hypothetical protein